LLTISRTPTRATTTLWISDHKSQSRRAEHRPRCYTPSRRSCHICHWGSSQWGKLNLWWWLLERVERIAMGEPAVHIVGVLCRVKISPLRFIGTLVIALLSRIGDKKIYWDGVGRPAEQAERVGRYFVAVDGRFTYQMDFMLSAIYVDLLLICCHCNWLTRKFRVGGKASGLTSGLRHLKIYIQEAWVLTFPKHDNTQVHIITNHGHRFGCRQRSLQLRRHRDLNP